MLSGAQESEKWYWLKWLRRLYGRGGNWTVICCYITQLLLVINHSKTLVVQCNKHFVLLTALDLMWGGSADLTYASVARCGSLGGLDDLGWTLSPVWGFGLAHRPDCALFHCLNLQQANGICSHKVLVQVGELETEQNSSKSFESPVSNYHIVPSTAFYWPNQVTRPSQTEGAKCLLHLLIWVAAKSHSRECGYRELTELFLQLIYTVIKTEKKIMW